MKDEYGNNFTKDFFDYIVDLFADYLNGKGFSGEAFRHDKAKSELLYVLRSWSDMDHPWADTVDILCEWCEDHGVPEMTDSEYKALGDKVCEYLYL